MHLSNCRLYAFQSSLPAMSLLTLLRAVVRVTVATGFLARVTFFIAAFVFRGTGFLGTGFSGMTFCFGTLTRITGGDVVRTTVVFRAFGGGIGIASSSVSEPESESDDEDSDDVDE